MKVAGIKGIRVIMGAAKDERGSVFRNTNLKVAISTVESRLYRNPTLEKRLQKLGVHCYTVSYSTFE